MSVLASERHWPGIKRLRFTSSAAHQENRQLHVRCVSNCVNYPLMSAPLMSPCPTIRINALFRFGGVLKFCKQNLLLLSYICLLMVLRTSKAGCFLFLSFPTLQQKSFWQEFLTLDSFSNTTYIITCMHIRRKYGYIYTNFVQVIAFCGVGYFKGLKHFIFKSWHQLPTFVGSWCSQLFIVCCLFKNVKYFSKQSS